MRVPDRPWAETDASGDDSRRTAMDYRTSSGRLADRLARLLAGHPSADGSANPHWSDLPPEDLDQGDTDLGEGDTASDLSRHDEDADELSAEGLAPDDLESGETGPGDVPGRGLRPNHGSDRPTFFDGFDGKDHDPYRPWFSADAANDPWFAAPTDGAGL